MRMKRQSTSKRKIVFFYVGRKVKGFVDFYKNLKFENIVLIFLHKIY